MFYTFNISKPGAADQSIVDWNVMFEPILVIV